MTSSIAPHGVYVELPNTVEGLIRMEDMPEGEYDTQSKVILQNATTGRTYIVGDPIRVQVVACDVSAGNVDFIPAGTTREPRPERVREARKPERQRPPPVNCRQDNKKGRCSP